MVDDGREVLGADHAGLVENQEGPGPDAREHSDPAVIHGERSAVEGLGHGLGGGVDRRAQLSRGDCGRRESDDVPTSGAPGLGEGGHRGGLAAAGWGQGDLDARTAGGEPGDHVGLARIQRGSVLGGTADRELDEDVLDCVWITTPTGRRQRKSVYGKTREEVHTKWLHLHQEARRGPVAPVSPRLRDFLRRWLRETVKPNLSPTTAKNYEMFARLCIVPDLGNRKLDKLMVRDVQVWVNALRTRSQCCAQGKDAAREVPRCCAIGECCHEVASDWTIHQAWRVLSGALTQAMREELVFRNVAALVRVPMPRRQEQPVWTVEEARRFLESARVDDDPLYAAYVLLLTLGLRRGELLGLAWEDVDLERGEALIAWQVQRVDGQLMRRHTKAPSSDAPLPLPEIAVRALERHRVDENRRRLSAGEMWGDCGLVLTTRHGDPVDPRNFHRDFKLRAVKAGVPVIPVHAARRTCASLLVALEVHPRVAMAVLRHSHIALTMEVYSQVSAESTRQTLHQLGTRLSNG